MALSGTLETFSLPDVLRLLASTKKTGLLALDGDRGRGRVWVDGGEIVAADADRAVVDEVDAVLFELLRFADASFEFDTTAELPDGAGAPREVDDALEIAGSRLAEWREIEAVVPSLDVRVRMVPELEADATVRPADWRVLARIGTGASGHDLAGHLVQGEYDVCRRLRDLVDAGLVELTGEVEEPAPTAVAAEEVSGALEVMLHAPVPETPVPETPVFEVAVAELQSEPELDDAEPLAAFDPESEAEPRLPTWDVAPTEPPASGLAAAEAELRGEADDTDASELLSDLAHLSPRAAAAVEATWAAEAPEPSEPEAIDPGAKKDDLDQNLLLRFLSSSKP